MDFPSRCARDFRAPFEVDRFGLSVDFLTLRLLDMPIGVLLSDVRSPSLSHNLRNVVVIQAKPAQSNKSAKLSELLTGTKPRKPN